MPFQTDRIGPYELRGELGRGAMARVWRAWDTNLEREVAIKEPLYDSWLSTGVTEELSNRFVAEGRAAARLSQHPNIVTIYAADIWDGRPAIVMELIEGATLSTLLARGALTPQETVSVLDQLLDAVGYAHEHGIVHRDIKPDNVFVTSSGVVKLADFGIAHVDYAAATRATVAGAVLGTPGYMSPEQAVGRPVDGRSDLFSVGVLAYEMLTGRNPFGIGYDADSTTAIYRIVREPVAELPDSVTSGLQVDLRPAIMASLQKDPALRPQTAREFKAMLHGGTAAENNFPVSSGATTIERRPGAPSWLPYAVVGGLLSIALLFITLSATSGGGGGGGAPVAAASGQAQEESSKEESTEKASSEEETTKEETTKEESSDTKAGSSSTKKNSKSSDKDSSSSNESSGSSKSKSAGSAKVEVADNEISNAAYPPYFDMLSSSSSLPSTQDNTYTPFNVTDGDWSTVWGEGVPGSGIGEYIVFNATSPQRVSGFNIVAGDPKEQDIYYRNNRPSRMRVELSDGWQCEITLEDAYYSSQKVTFDGPHATTYVKLTILDVYASNRDDDTVIAEIEPF
ncbi:MAG: protein kinase [Atopobiaceae bacterium]|nr:protein kinase [Atopobiaceae bacterium]